MTVIEKVSELTGKPVDELNDICPRDNGVMTRGCGEDYCNECFTEEFECMTLDYPKDKFKHLNLDRIGDIFYSDDELIITGVPDENESHNCDIIGCSSISHVIFKCKIQDTHR